MILALNTALGRHWPEYLMEAAGLGIFMISAGLFGTLLEYPQSPVHQAIADDGVRRMLMGVAMGLTAVAIIYSPWGQQSGAHLNPAVTLTFLRLGKIARADALFYITAQCLGGLAGVLAVALTVGEPFTQPPVSYVITAPGAGGPGTAFISEVLIAFGMMTMVLFTSNHRQWSRYTGVFAGLLVALYIAIEAPLSGMSLNPARSLASALPARMTGGLWIYFTAPLLGMLSAAVVFDAVRGRSEVKCAKLNHHTSRRCIFHCGFGG
jgi:aquaporin Z